MFSVNEKTNAISIRALIKCKLIKNSLQRRLIMIRKILYGLAACVTFIQVQAKTPQEEIETLSPGWKVASFAQGDLSLPGANDIAAIMTQDDSKISLQIFFRDGSGKLNLKAQFPTAVCINCGGAKSGPIPFGIQIKNNVLIIDKFGGSREFFQKTTKWRYQNNDFSLIGLEEKVQDSQAQGTNSLVMIDRDVNILSLKMNETIQRLNAKNKKITKTSSCAVDKKYAEYTLSKFDSDNYNIPTPMCSKVKF